MKHVLPFFLFLTVVFPLTAGAQSIPLADPALNQPLPRPERPGPDAYLPISGNSEAASPRAEFGLEIGYTWFDYQSLGNRMLFTHPDGEIYAAWHFAADAAAGAPSRGAAANAFNGSEWGAQPSERLEGDTRSGYPDFTVLGDKTQVAISHSSIDNVWELGVYTQPEGSDEWKQSFIPLPQSAAYGGMVWPKIATGGADDQSLHVIAITLGTAFGGSVYQGMDGHLLYFRSQDGGANWDITDFAIPGCDSTYFDAMDSQSYMIEAHEETVAIGVFPAWGDATLYKSTDNGDSWSRQLILDFPLDKYDDSGYTASDIPMDPNAPDSLAIYSTDGWASMLVDDNGKVHVTFGNMYVLGENGERFYFPGTDGISYWNEDMAAGEFHDVAFVEDMDDSGAIELAGQIAQYFLSLSSMPSLSIDDEGRLYVLYSAVNELYVNEDDDQNYRHLYLVYSEDGGVDWSDPYAVINEETVEDVVIPFTEAIFPSLPSRVDSRIPLIFMQDFQPGLNIIGDMDPAVENAIIYIALDQADLGLVSQTELQQNPIELSVFPNPTAGDLVLQYRLEETARPVFRILDLTGRPRLNLEYEQMPAGEYNSSLKLESLPAGIYFLELRLNGARSAVQRIIKQ
jgi:hypothetical protein